MRTEVIENALKALNQVYVLREMAALMEQAIRDRQKRKEYDSLTRARKFAETLTEHLQAVSQDKHLRVNYAPQTLPPQPPPDRTLYFDIEVLLDYNEQPKTALDGGVLESELKRGCFEQLVCVSGWSDMAHADPLHIAEPERRAWIHRMLAPLFPDVPWFLGRALPTARHRPLGLPHQLESDWYYVDDWADQFFRAAH